MIKLLPVITGLVTSVTALAGCPSPDTSPRCEVTISVVPEPTSRETITGVNPDCRIHINLSPELRYGATAQSRCEDYWGGTYRPSTTAATCWDIEL